MVTYIARLIIFLTWFSRIVNLVIDWLNWPVYFYPLWVKSISQRPTIFDRVPPLIGSGTEVYDENDFTGRMTLCHTNSMENRTPIVMVKLGTNFYQEVKEVYQIEKYVHRFPFAVFTIYDYDFTIMTTRAWELGAILFNGDLPTAKSASFHDAFLRKQLSRRSVARNIIERVSSFRFVKPLHLCAFVGFMDRDFVVTVAWVFFLASFSLVFARELQTVPTLRG